MFFIEAFDPFIAYMESLERSAETIRVYRARLENFNRYIEQRFNGPVYLDDISTDMIEKFLIYLKTDRHLVAGSRAHILHVLRSFFRYAEQRKMVEINPTAVLKSVKVPQKERNYLSEFEVNQLIEKIDSPRQKLICRTLFGSGLRISECLNLTLDAVDFEKKCLHVRLGKGAKDRIVPLGEKLVYLLREYVTYERPHVSSERLFLSRRGYAVHRQSVNSALQTAARQLGWNAPVSAHILRHSYASQLIKTGANLVQVQRLLGHSSLAVTGIYTHTYFEDLQEAVNRL